VSLLRERFAKKRGEGKTESLDAPADDGGNPHEPSSSDSPLADLEQRELAQRLGASLAELKPPLGEILSDFFLQGFALRGDCEEAYRGRRLGGRLFEARVGSDAADMGPGGK
jgi:hypothetical protein